MIRGDRIGVSRTAAYRHFSDKAALLEAISEAGGHILVSVPALTLDKYRLKLAPIS
jgi:AcrR family transcriptional regulator